MESTNIGLSLRDQLPYLQILYITNRPRPAGRLVVLTFHPLRVPDQHHRDEMGGIAGSV